MGRKNGEYFNDNLIKGEVGELGTSIRGPSGETAAIINLVAKQAITLNNFCDMFYAGPRKANKFEIDNFKGADGKIFNREFGPAKKKGDAPYSYLGVWAPLGKTTFNENWSTTDPRRFFLAKTVDGKRQRRTGGKGQYYDFSRQGGVYNSQKTAITETDEAIMDEVLMAYAIDDGDNPDSDNNEFGNETFLAHRDILNHIINITGVDTQCWDLASKKRIFKKLYNLQIGKRFESGCFSNDNLQYICGRSLKQLNQSLKDYAIKYKITELYQSKGWLGLGGNAGLHLFVNVRVNIGGMAIQDVLLRIRYPIYLRVGDKIAGLEVKQLPG